MEASAFLGIQLGQGKDSSTDCDFGVYWVVSVFLISC